MSRSSRRFLHPRPRAAPGRGWNERLTTVFLWVDDVNVAVQEIIASGCDDDASVFPGAPSVLTDR